MIILVNIGKSLAKGMSHLEATKRMLKLNLERCKACDYVVGVAHGVPQCFFLLKDVFPDIEDPTRVAFDLEPCYKEEEENLMKILRWNNTNFKGIQRGRYV